MSRTYKVLLHVQRSSSYPAGTMKGARLILLASLFGIAASEEFLKVKLVSGNHRCTGRLEVEHDGEWATVCDHNWSRLNFKVVCKQLNCGAPRTFMPCGSRKKGSGAIWMNEVKCTGDERSLSECPVTPLTKHKCAHKQEVWVTCREPFQARLVDGPSRCIGRLEVYHDGQWGSVCDDHWDDKDANVICSQINCGSCQPYMRRRKRFGQSQGKIWLDDVECSGDEPSLEECKHRVWSYNDCTHMEDVSVYCTG
ncbi:CD5 antigen-like isoform X1 [Bufo bufo]|uniref:CD5 antigen-like isoform X1 n=1 Tax=Bufo bufo TaxID=8384 RepID=UPI001ABDFB55|nr:CD5 antigen-like isoform X1 [Bufo bufo]